MGGGGNLNRKCQVSFFGTGSAPANVVRQMRSSSWRNRKKFIEHEFLGRVSGKFPGPTGNTWKGSPVYQDGMFQTEMRVPLVKSHL